MIELRENEKEEGVKFVGKAHENSGERSTLEFIISGCPLDPVLSCLLIQPPDSHAEGT